MSRRRVENGSDGGSDFSHPVSVGRAGEVSSPEKPAISVQTAMDSPIGAKLKAQQGSASEPDKKPLGTFASAPKGPTPPKVYKSDRRRSSSRSSSSSVSSGSSDPWKGVGKGASPGKKKPPSIITVTTVSTDKDKPGGKRLTGRRRSSSRSSSSSSYTRTTRSRRRSTSTSSTSSTTSCSTCTPRKKKSPRGRQPAPSAGITSTTSLSRANSEPRLGRRGSLSTSGDGSSYPHGQLSSNPSCTGGLKSALRSMMVGNNAVAKRRGPPPSYSQATSRSQPRKYGSYMTGSSVSHDTGTLVDARRLRRRATSTYTDDDTCSCSLSDCSIRQDAAERRKGARDVSPSSSSSDWSSTDLDKKPPRRRFLNGKSPWVSSNSDGSYTRAKPGPRFSQIMTEDDEDDFDDSVSRPGDRFGSSKRRPVTSSSEGLTLTDASASLDSEKPPPTSRMQRLAAIGATLDRTGKSRGGYTPDLPPVPQYMTGGYLDPYGGLTPQFDPYSAAYGLPMQQQYAMPPQTWAQPPLLLDTTALMPPPPPPAPSYIPPPPPQLPPPPPYAPQQARGGNRRASPSPPHAPRPPVVQKRQPLRAMQPPPIPPPSVQSKNVVTHLEGELRYLRGIVRSLTRNKAAAHRERWVETLPDSVAAAIGGTVPGGRPMPAGLRKKKGKKGLKKGRGRQQVSRPAALLKSAQDSFSVAAPTPKPRARSAAPALNSFTLGGLATEATPSYRALKGLFTQQPPPYPGANPEPPLNWRSGVSEVPRSAMPMPPVKQPSASTASSAPTESVEARIARSMDSSLQTSGRVTFVTMKADEPASVGAPPVALAPAPAPTAPVGPGGVLFSGAKPPLVPTSILAPLPRNSQSSHAPIMTSSPLRPAPTGNPNLPAAPPALSSSTSSASSKPKAPIVFTFPPTANSPSPPAEGPTVQVGIAPYSKSTPAVSWGVDSTAGSGAGSDQNPVMQSTLRTTSSQSYGSDSGPLGIASGRMLQQRFTSADSDDDPWENVEVDTEVYSVKHPSGGPSPPTAPLFAQ